MLFRFWVFPDCTFLDISKDIVMVDVDVLVPKDHLLRKI